MTSAIANTTTLRQRAIAALAEQQQQEARYRQREQEQLTARTLAQFKNDFDHEPESVVGNLVQVADDEGDLKGGTLTLRYDCGDGYWELWGRCPTCGEECWSRRIRDLLQLGRQLDEFESPRSSEHRCPAPTEKAIAPASAAEMVLLEALRNYVREVRYG